MVKLFLCPFSAQRVHFLQRILITFAKSFIENKFLSEVIDMDISNTINAVKVSGSSNSSVKKLLKRTSGN